MTKCYLYTFHHWDEDIDVFDSASLNDVSPNTISQKVLEAFKGVGWDGDSVNDKIQRGYLPPFLFFGVAKPVEFFHVKQRNNGTSFVLIVGHHILAAELMYESETQIDI